MATEKLYIAKLASGEELGPADQDALIKLAEAGTITSTTMVRSKLIPEWDKAGDVDFLKAIIFKQQQAEMAEKARNKPFLEKLHDRITLVAPEPVQKGQVTRVRTEALPVPSVSLRLFAGITDIIVLIILLTGAFFGAKHCLETGVLTDENAAYVATPAFIAIVLMYFTLSIACMTQTIGQRFWGIFLIRTNGKRFWAGRAFLFSVFLMVFGLFAPIFFILNVKTYPELLTRTRFAKVIAQKKR